MANLLSMSNIPEDKKTDVSSEIKGFASEADKLLKALDSIEEPSDSSSKPATTRSAKENTPAKPKTGISSRTTLAIAGTGAVIALFSLIFFAFIQLRQSNPELSKEQAQKGVVELIKAKFSLLISQEKSRSAIADYLAQARALKGKKGSEQEVVRLTSRALAISQNAEAYYLRAYAKSDLGDEQGALADLNQAITLNPQNAIAYYNRAIAKSHLGDQQGAITDYSQVIAIDPQLADAYVNRAGIKHELSDYQGACSDVKKAVSLGHQSMTEWLQSDGGLWCRNMR